MGKMTISNSKLLHNILSQPVLIFRVSVFLACFITLYFEMRIMLFVCTVTQSRHLKKCFTARSKENQTCSGNFDSRVFVYNQRVNMVDKCDNVLSLCYLQHYHTYNTDLV